MRLLESIATWFFVLFSHDDTCATIVRAMTNDEWFRIGQNVSKLNYEMK